jgi:3-oxoacyl-[acyl-carrier-protein] synthase II
LHRASYLAFEKQGWLSGRPPDEALRPFDRDADGLILGEGAAVAVLERASDARDRGVPVLAEIDGFGSAAGGADANGPFAAFSGLAAAVAAAKISGTPDFIVASGFGLPAADRAEAAVLSAVFGNNIPVTAFKGLTGYLGAATGLVEIVLGILALRNRLIPAVAHFGTAAEDVDLNIVSSQARPLPPMRPVSALFLSASWFGASAAVLVRHSGR